MTFTSVPRAPLPSQAATPLTRRGLPGGLMRRVLRTAGVGGVAFAVLTACVLYADEEGDIRASADQIAYVAGVRLDTARRHIRLLRAGGLLELRDRGRGRAPNTYHLPGADVPKGGAA